MLRSAVVDEIKIPEELLEEFECLPDAGSGPAPWAPTEQQRELILRFYPKKNKAALAKKIGISYGTLKRVYNELTET